MLERELLYLMLRGNKKMDSFKMMLITILVLQISLQKSSTRNVGNEDNNIPERVEDSSLSKTPTYDDQCVVTYNGQKLDELERPISKSIDLTSNGGIADIIKRMYQGVNIEVSLINGKEITGEVVSSYQGVLILRATGILHYINDKYIVSFH